MSSPGPVLAGTIAPPARDDVDAVAAVHHWQASWPGAEVVGADTWRLRASGGFTKRANSALALPSRRPLAEQLDATTTFFAERGLPPIVVDHDHLPVAGLAGTLRDRGWRALAPDPILTAPAAAVLERTGPVAGAVDVTVVPGPRVSRPQHTDSWWEGLVAAGRSPSEVCDAVVLGSPVTLLAVLPGPDRPLAIGRAGLSGDWAGLNCLWTDPAHRGGGLGTQVIAALTRTAVGLGAGRLQLAVESGNLRARSLYERLGFTLRCHYRYWIAPDACGPPTDDAVTRAAPDLDRTP